MSVWYVVLALDGDCVCVCVCVARQTIGILTIYRTNSLYG